MTSQQDKIEQEYKFRHLINNNIYLNAKYRHTSLANKFPDNILLILKKQFWEIYKANVLKRADKVIQTEKEIEVIKHCFEWTICSPDFKGNLSKGLLIVSSQGFGKDVMLRTIVEFYDYYSFSIKEYTYFNFCNEWFNKSPEMFKSPIKITDIYDNGTIKRERESIPILEFLDFREQNYLTRGLLASSNYKPEVLQELLEGNKIVKRLHERIKECFNVVIITETDSKRIESTKII